MASAAPPRRAGSKPSSHACALGAHRLRHATTAPVFQFGLLGIELSFVINGFVILMMAKEVRSVPSFVLARILRVYPATTCPSSGYRGPHVGA